MRWIAFTFIILIISTSATAQIPAIYYQEDSPLSGKYGVVNTRNETVIPFEYDQILKPSGGWVACRKGDKFGIIDTLGNTIVPFEYDNIDPIFGDTVSLERNGEFSYIDRNKNFFRHIFHKGYSIDNKSKEYGVIDTLGNEIIPFKYKHIYRDGDSLFIALNKDFKYGVLEPNNNTIIPFKHSSIYPFNDLYLVEADFKKGFITKTNKGIIPCIYEGFEPWNDSLIILAKERFNEYSVFNTKQQRLYSIYYKRIFPSGKNYAIATNDKNKQGVIDTNGNVLVPFIYKSIHTLAEGIFFAQKKKLYGVINSKNEEIQPFVYNYENTDPFLKTAVARITESREWVILDSLGQTTSKFTLPQDYSSASLLTPKLLRFHKKGKNAVIDNKGNLLANNKFEDITILSELKRDFNITYIKASINGKCGLMDENLNILIPFEYEYIAPVFDFWLYPIGSCELLHTPTKNNWFQVKKNGKYGVVDSSGNVLLPCAYRYILGMYGSDTFVVVKSDKKLP